MKKLLLTLLFSLPTAAFAQSTECNILNPASVNTKNPPAAFQVCWTAKDDQGTDYAASEVSAMKVFVGGVLVKTVPNPLSIAQSPNAAGSRLFSTPGLGVNIAKGDRVATYSFVTVDGETEQSVAYPFKVIGSPARPHGGRVVPLN